MMIANRTFILQIGKTAIRVHCESPALCSHLQQRYAGFLTPGAVQGECFDIKILRPQLHNPLIENKTLAFSTNGFVVSPPGWEGSLDISKKAGWVSPGSRPVEEADYFLRVVCAVQVFQAGGLLFHAAGILKEGRAYVFFGPSGIGKTTVSRLSGEETVLNDDLILLLPGEEGWFVFSTPFANPSQVPPLPGRSAPLAGMYRLVQDQQVFIENSTPGHILAEVIANTPVISTDPTRTKELLSRCQKLLATIPVYRLHFRKDNSFWPILEKEPANQSLKNEPKGTI